MFFIQIFLKSLKMLKPADTDKLCFFASHRIAQHRTAQHSTAQNSTAQRNTAQRILDYMFAAARAASSTMIVLRAANTKAADGFESGL